MLSFVEVVLVLATASAAADLTSEYYANNSMVGTSIACTKDERTCLSLNMLYHPPSNRCVRFGYEKDACLYAADRCAYEGSDRLVATCHFRKQCPHGGAPLPMAWDGRCVASEARCPCDGGVSLPPSARPPALHLFGGAQCACAEDLTDRKYVFQPQEKGRCLVPNFLSSPHQKLAAETFPFKMKCPEQWKKCNVTNNEVWLRDEGCVPLFADSVCTEGLLPMLVAPEKGRLRRSAPLARVRCFGKNRDCGQSEVRTAIDRRCHDRELFERTASLHRDVFGYFHLQMRKTPAPSSQLVECVEYVKRSGRQRRNPKNRRRGRANERRTRRGKISETPKGTRRYT